MTGQLNADVDGYLQAAAMNVPPPQIISDPLVTGTTPVEQLLRVLGLAANLGDAQDNADSIEEHAQRDAMATEAADKFAAQDEEAAQELNSVALLADPVEEQALTPGIDQTTAMAQQLPQAASSIAGAVTGALGGALQPLAQIPQQISQGAQQAMQAGTSLLQQAARPAEDSSLVSTPMDEFGSTAGDLTDLGAGADLLGLGGGELSAGGGIPGGFGGGFVGGTAPTSTLGPPPVPSASTAPSSAPATRISAPTAPVAQPTGTGMTGMPMVPPGAMGATTGVDKDAKADTRRVSVPPVRNGAPVQGRLSTPPALPSVTKKVDGTPVVTRRVVIPNSKTNGADDPNTSDR